MFLKNRKGLQAVEMVVLIVLVLGISVTVIGTITKGAGDGANQAANAINAIPVFPTN